MSFSSQARMLVGAMLVASACAKESTTAPGPVAARTTLPRELTAAEHNVLSSANAFSFALWREINKTKAGSNVFVSPLSASFALGMTMNGAAGTTRDEMYRALQYGTTPVSEVNAGYKGLLSLLTTLDPTVTMEIANSIWYRKTFAFNQSFLDVGRASFDAAISPLDFSNATGAKATINGWVNDKTHGRIQSIVDEISQDDAMFLINAIYFKGSWRAKFDPALTIASTFHGFGGDRPASLMHREAPMAYARANGYQAVDLAYGDSSFTMTVVLPDAGTNIEALAASLDAATWSSLVQRLSVQTVDLFLPKLKLEWKRDLIPDLQSLGMRAAFIDADFTPMSPAGRQLVISQVRHKTFVEIDEAGTEAAAVTSVGITVTSAPVVQVMRVDRPFIFAIRERLTGTILFMGKVGTLTEP